MKKILLLSVIILTVISFRVNVSATQDFKEEISDKLFSSFDKEVYDAMEDFGITGLETDEIFDISFDSVFSYFKNNINVLFSDSIRMFSKIFILIFIVGVMGILFDNKDYKRILSLVSVICTTVIIVEEVNLCLSSAASLIKLNNSFMLTFAPIYAIVITASGNPSLALTYNTVILGLSELISFFINYGLIDLLGCYFCLCVALSVNQNINYSRIISSVNRASSFILGLLSSVFASVLSLRGVMSAASDGVVSKGIRFAAGSLIPVIGSSISEAYSAILGSINIIKGSVAIVGIIAVLLINLPVIIEILLFNISLNCLSFISEILDCRELTNALKGFAGGIKILGLLVIFEMIVFIISTSVMLSLKGG